MEVMIEQIRKRVERLKREYPDPFEIIHEFDEAPLPESERERIWRGEITEAQLEFLKLLAGRSGSEGGE